MMDRLANPNLRIPNTEELEEDFEHNQRLKDMISKCNKNNIKQVTHQRDKFLERIFSNINSTFGGDSKSGSSTNNLKSKNFKRECAVKYQSVDRTGILDFSKYSSEQLGIQKELSYASGTGA